MSARPAGATADCELQTLAGEFGIREEGFKRMIQDTPADHSNGSIVLDFAKCIKCGRCVQVCQDVQDVWALSFLQRGIETRMAPAGDILAGGFALHQVRAVRGALPDRRHRRERRNRHGLGSAAGSGEVLHGADRPECAGRLGRRVRLSAGHQPDQEDLPGRCDASASRRCSTRISPPTSPSWRKPPSSCSASSKGTAPLPLITSCCPAWTDYMEKYHHDFVDNFSTAKSPQQMLGVMAKTYYSEQMGIDPATHYQVSIMPCTAKKYELERTDEMFASGHQDVDVVLTTREFARMIKQSGIDFRDLPDGEADSILGDYSGAGHHLRCDRRSDGSGPAHGLLLRHRGEHARRGDQYPAGSRA